MRDDLTRNVANLMYVSSWEVCWCEDVRPGTRSSTGSRPPLAKLQGFGGLPRPEEAGAIWDDIWHLEAHNSTAIEGNTLVLREVEQLLSNGKAVGAKPLKGLSGGVGIQRRREVGVRPGQRRRCVLAERVDQRHQSA